MDAIIQQHKEISKIEALLRTPKKAIKWFSKQKSNASPIQSNTHQGIMNHIILSRYPNRIWPAWIQSHLNQEKGTIVQSLPWCITNTHFNQYIELCSQDGRSVIQTDPLGMVTLSDQWSIELFLKTDRAIIRLSDHCTPIQSYDPSTQRIETQYTTNWGHINWSGLLTKSGFKLEISPLELNPNYSIIAAIRPYNIKGISPIHSIQYIAAGGIVINKKIGLTLDKKPDNIVCTSLHNEDPLTIMNKWTQLLDIECQWGLGSCVLEWSGQELTAPISLYHPFSNKTLPSWKYFVKSKQTDNEWLIPMHPHIKELNAQPSPSSEKMAQLAIQSQPKLSYIWQTNIQLALQSSKKTLLANIKHNQIPNLPLFMYFYATIHFASSDTIHNQLDFILSRQTPFKHLKGQAQQLILLNKLHTIQPKIYALLSGKKVETLTQKLLKNIHKSNKLNIPALFHDSSEKPFQYETLLWVLGSLNAIQSLPLNNQYRNQAKTQLSCLGNLLNDIWKHAAKRQQVAPIIPINYTQFILPQILNNLVAIYPLNTPISNEICNQTIEALESEFTVNDLFCPQTHHSGINTFSNVFLAQVYLNQKNPKFYTLFKWLIDTSLPGGNWPEFVHPDTQNGSFGRGHDHTTSLELLMLIRNMILSDESPQTLVLFPGISAEWISQTDAPLTITNWPTRYGLLSLNLTTKAPQHYELEIQVDQPHPKTLAIFFPHSIKTIETNNRKIEVSQQPIEIPFPKDTISLYL